MEKITHKIVGYKVVNEQKPLNAIDQLEKMHEGMARPDVLHGSTYKIKTPDSDHALYITVNDYVLNADTEHRQRVPYEVFINSKNMEHFQWVVALTRLISAVFRKGGDVEFMIVELENVFDPKGGYFKKGKFIPSLVAEIGGVLKRHLINTGLIKTKEMTDIVKQVLAEKRQQFEEQEKIRANNVAEDGFPLNATVCNKCKARAVVLMDGCKCCSDCGNSSCS